MSKFKKHYKIVDEHFKDLKERCIINEIIHQSILQKTEKPLIEQTYFALLCGCSRMTIHRKLKRLKENGCIMYKMVVNSKGYTTTQITITEKLKDLIKVIGKDKKANRIVKDNVINTIIPKIDNTPLSIENCNF